MNDLKFAIDMELEGEKYYREQAAINHDNSLATVCLLLMEDEKRHARILTEKGNAEEYHLLNTDTLAKAKNIFTGAGDMKLEIKVFASQLDFYRIASEKEKQSINLYAGFLSNAVNEKEKELFEYLVGQENQHLAVLEELDRLLSRVEEWVENAEFGVREEY